MPLRNYIFGKSANILKKIYVRPGSRAYRRNYFSGEDRRILFPENVLKELEIPGEHSDLPAVLNISLSLCSSRDCAVYLARVRDMDNRLMNEREYEIREFLREEGMKYVKRLLDLESIGFLESYESLMNLFDIALGAEHTDLITPMPGSARYKYPSEHYPFAENSPSEIAVWSFSQGAASMLHSKNKNGKRMMKAMIKRFPSFVIIESKESFLWSDRELELTI